MRHGLGEQLSIFVLVLSFLILDNMCDVPNYDHLRLMLFEIDAHFLQMSVYSLILFVLFVLSTVLQLVELFFLCLINLV